MTMKLRIFALVLAAVLLSTTLAGCVKPHSRGNTAVVSATGA